MDTVSKPLQAILLWQVVTLSSSQFLQQMPQMQFPGMGMGHPMAPMMGPSPQMQMPPIPPMNMPHMPPMQMPIGLGQPKLPVVVMPYHSKSLDKQRSKRKRDKKRRRRRAKDRRSHSEESYESDTDTDSSEDDTRRSGRRSSVRRRHQVLTPVISYVTKDGYVVYQKKIKKERAKEWLDLGKNRQTEDQKNLVEETSGEESELSEETLREIKHRFKQAKKKRDRRDRRH